MLFKHTEEITFGEVTEPLTATNMKIQIVDTVSLRMNAPVHGLSSLSTLWSDRNGTKT
jgi:hypothetical protein